jgi:hypothetical protein
MMRLYDRPHKWYAGIDLHARTMHLCVLDPQGTIVHDSNLPCRPDAFLAALAPFRQDVILGAECMFGCYWLADLCHQEQDPFLIGHALSMRAIHGAKAKNDRIDANKIARLLRGATSPGLRLPQGHARDPRPAPPTQLLRPPAAGVLHPFADPQCAVQPAAW